MMYIMYTVPDPDDRTRPGFNETKPYESIVDLVEDLHMFLDAGMLNVRVEIGGVLFRPSKLTMGGINVRPLGPA